MPITGIAFSLYLSVRHLHRFYLFIVSIRPVLITGFAFSLYLYVQRLSPVLLFVIPIRPAPFSGFAFSLYLYAQRLSPVLSFRYTYLSDTFPRHLPRRNARADPFLLGKDSDKMRKMNAEPSSSLLLTPYHRSPRTHPTAPKLPSSPINPRTHFPTSAQLRTLFYGGNRPFLPY